MRFEGGRTVGAMVTRLLSKNKGAKKDPSEQKIWPVAQLAEQRFQNRRLGVRPSWPARSKLGQIATGVGVRWIFCEFK